MTFADLIRTVLRQLAEAGIPYMVTGSVASSYFGEPRATRDLDVVIEPDSHSLEALLDRLVVDGFYVDRDVAREALQSRTQFNAIGTDALKVDFLVRRDRPFSVAEFKRRQSANLLGVAGFVPSVEDLIVAKLEWAAAGPSELQLRDVAGMLAVAGPDIDQAYLMSWIKTLNLEAVWNEVAP